VVGGVQPRGALERDMVTKQEKQSLRARRTYIGWCKEQRFNTIWGNRLSGERSSERNALSLEHAPAEMDAGSPVECSRYLSIRNAGENAMPTK
jgi:hypothetical protein